MDAAPKTYYSDDIIKKYGFTVAIHDPHCYGPFSSNFDSTPRSTFGPFRASAKIRALPRGYNLQDELDIILEYLDYPVREVLAIWPEVGIYGEGEEEAEAIADLKNELIDLFEDLNSTPDAELGPKPKMWKAILNRLIKKV